MMKCIIKKCFVYLLLATVALAASCSMANAAATWTVQAERYHKYDTTPLNLTDSSYKYIVTTDLESYNVNWLRLDGVYIKEISSGGAVRYTKEPVVVPPLLDECKGQFICHPQWGWIVNINQNQVLKCAAIKIRKEEAAVFDNVQSVNGEPTCAVK